MRAARWVLLVVLVAGCAANTSPPTRDEGATGAPPGWAERILAFGEDHDHLDPAQHADLTTPNFEVLGYDPLLSEHYGGTTPPGYVCGDAQETTDGRRLAVVESRSELGFAIADVTDPEAPRWLGEMVMRATYVYDVAMVPDAKHVVLVTTEIQQNGILPPLPPAPFAQWRDACGATVPILAPEDPIPRPSSLILVSIEDPHAPAIVDQRPLAGYGHSAFSTILDGRTWVLASAVATGGTDTFSFYEIVDTPLGGRLNLVSTFVPPAEQDQLNPELGGHDDGVIQMHPATGQTLAWLVNRRDLTIVDLADPLRPALVGRWSDFSQERREFSANMHSAFPLPELVDGRHYTVIGPEWVAKPAEVPSGIVWVLDTTDPTAPTLVAGWTLPIDPAWSGDYMFSTHYLSVAWPTLFVSMYHGGVWAVDLGPIVGATEFVSLPSIGAFLPTRDDVVAPEGWDPFRWTPTSEEVISFVDGSLVTFDSNTGLWVFTFDETKPAPSPAPWSIVPP